MNQNIDMGKLLSPEAFKEINRREFEKLKEARKQKESASDIVPIISESKAAPKLTEPEILPVKNMLPTSNLEQFQEQLNNPNKAYSNHGIPGTELNEKKISRIHKNMILSFSSDTTGCGHIRNIFLMTYLNAVFAKSKVLRTAILPFFYYQHDVLMQARSLFFPRTMSDEYKVAVHRYKDMQQRYKYKMIYDIDDFIWQGDDKGERIPEYNFGHRQISNELAGTVKEIMGMMDLVCVSTDFLKKYIAEKLKVTIPIVVLPNCVPRYFYGPNRRPAITEKLMKPKFIYTGSPTHYDNEKKLLGDFDNAWVEYLNKNVRDGKIEFMLLGCNLSPQGPILPWFFESIKKYIYPVGWLNSYQYHLPILEYKPDFSIAPLVPNYFNYSKSDIRYIETCAFGAVFMGSVFTNGMPSPYDNASITLPDNCTVSDIEAKVDELSYPENFNDIIQKQYQYMEQAGRWLESEQYVNMLTKIF